jgi:hypothetical protein
MSEQSTRPPQTDTPAVEGATNEALMAGIGATNRLLQKNLKLAQLNYDLREQVADLQRLIDRAIDVMYDTMGKDDLMDYADFIDTLRKAGKGGGE